jgi:hypothetical protein
MLKVVDYPAPFGPKSPKIPLFGTKQETFLMAVNLFGYVFIILYILIGFSIEPSELIAP